MFNIELHKIKFHSGKPGNLHNIEMHNDKMNYVKH